MLSPFAVGVFGLVALLANTKFTPAPLSPSNAVIAEGTDQSYEPVFCVRTPIEI